MGEADTQNLQLVSHCSCSVREEPCFTEKPRPGLGAAVATVSTPKTHCRAVWWLAVLTVIYRQGT